jgi:hypothetical protein
MTVPELTAEDRRLRAQRDKAAQRASDEAVEALTAALERAGLVLPSLRSTQPVAGGGFVELGGCSSDLAARLAVIVAAGAQALRADR